MLPKATTRGVLHQMCPSSLFRLLPNPRNPCRNRHNRNFHPSARRELTSRSRTPILIPNLRKRRPSGRENVARYVSINVPSNVLSGNSCSFKRILIFRDDFDLQIFAVWFRLEDCAFLAQFDPGRGPSRQHRDAPLLNPAPLRPVP